MTAMLGFYAGAWFSRLPGRGWAVGYLLALFLTTLYWIGNTFPAASQTPPVSWLVQGRTKFVMIAFLAPMLFVPLLPRLKRKGERVGLVCFLVVVIFAHSVWPVLATVFNRDLLSALETRVDSDGVCLQSTDYTCGPASAVTALRRLGISAGEGSIAIAAHSSQAAGTPPDVLATSLNQMFGTQGIHCEFRAFENLDELRECGLTIVVVRFNSLVDHYVTVLEVGRKSVLVGDPLSGLVRLSRTDFLKLWKHQGVVVARTMRIQEKPVRLIRV